MSSEELTAYTHRRARVHAAAARFAGVNPGSRCWTWLRIRRGRCSLAAEFRCKVTAIDASDENIRSGRERAVEQGISHLVTFECAIYWNPISATSRSTWCLRGAY